MRFISASSVVFGVVLLARPAFSTEFWWVDKTCDEKLGKDVVHRMMEETVESAKMIRDRLIRSERDEPDAHRAFQALFQFKTSTDEPWDKSRWEIFQRILGGFDEVTTRGVANYRQSPGDDDLHRQQAMICIYCDNGARWEDVQDGDELSKKDLPKNSERTPDKRERFDPINKIWAKGLVGCERSEELGDVMMQTYRWSGKSAYDIEYGGDELRGRNAITICDSWINLETRIDQFGELPSRADFWTSFRRERFGALRTIGSMVLLHEVTHTWPHSTIDRVSGENCFFLDKISAFMNADSYAILGIIMQFMERKYALYREFPGIGDLTHYDDIPDRRRYRKRSKVDSD